MSFMENANRALHTAGFLLKKHAPTILMVGGIAMVTAGTVKLVKNAEKEKKDWNEFLDTCKVDIDKHEENPEEFTQEDLNHAVVYHWGGIITKTAQNWGTGAVLWLGGMACVVAGHHILENRNAALSAALTATSEAFAAYRQKVIAKIGPEAEAAITKVDPKTKRDEKTGEETEVIDIPESELPGYGRIFDETVPTWDRGKGMNQVFLRQQEDILNIKLAAHGHMFLNEVYDQLGLTRTKAGQVVGWIYDPYNPDFKGASHIDIGLNKPSAKAFRQEQERSVTLEFNVDGNIMDKFVRQQEPGISQAPLEHIRKCPAF